MLNSKGFTSTELCFVFVIISVFVALVSICLSIVSSTENYINNQVITVSFTVEGASNFDITYNNDGVQQNINERIKGIKSFECDIPNNSDVTVKWDSDNDKNVDVKIEYNQTSKSLSGKNGECQFKTPSISTDCFINSCKIKENY